ncbi:MAG: hypothetical protein RLZ14_124 [Actinomycetota bacterium]
MGTADHSDAARSDAASLLGLLEGLDAGAVLLRPVLSERDTVLDAVVVWTSDRARSVWGDTPGVLASEVCPDFDEWLAAANGAWRGVAMRRLIETDHRRTGWTRAMSVVRRVDDHLSELTVDRSNDQELLDRIHDLDRTYRRLLDELPLVVVASRSGKARPEYVSPNVMNLLGRTPEEMGEYAAWFEVIPPEDHELASGIAKHLSTPGEFQTVGRLVHRDGSIRHCELRMTSKQHDIDGSVSFLITLLDVTEQQLLREQVENSKRLASLSRTAGAFAHEFASLMQIIVGNLDKLEPSTAGLSQKPIEAARDAANRATTLLGGLVAFASARPGKLEPVSIPALCEASHPLFLERLPSNVPMAIDLAPDLPMVVIPPESMRQIMFQLVDNAAEAMPDGGTLGITVREVPHAACHLNDAPGPGTWVSVAVSDEGRGIDPALLGYVWEPFFTSRTGAAARGAGLGLSIVHGAVHQADGHVTIASKPGVGTTVTLYLPGVTR